MWQDDSHALRGTILFLGVCGDQAIWAQHRVSVLISANRKVSRLGTVEIYEEEETVTAEVRKKQEACGVKKYQPKNIALHDNILLKVVKLPFSLRCIGTTLQLEQFLFKCLMFGF